VLAKVVDDVGVRDVDFIFLKKKSGHVGGS
jgi:hypothetical protein